jgi:hypothetical protein
LDIAQSRKAGRQFRTLIKIMHICLRLALAGEVTDQVSLDGVWR